MNSVSRFIVDCFAPFFTEHGQEIKQLGMKMPIPCFSEATLSRLITETLETLEEKRLIAHVDAPVNIIGATDGSITDLLRLLSKSGRFMDQTTIFLGGYCHKSHFSLECVTLLLALLNVHPDNFVVLRGRSESTQVQECGLIDDIVDRFGENRPLASELTKVLGKLPVIAVVGKEYVCTSGGLGSATAMRELKRAKGAAKEKIIAQIVNSNPAKEESVIEEFLAQASDIKKVISGYVENPIMNGVEPMFDGQLLVVSSASSIDGKHRIGYVTINKESKLRATGITPSRQVARVYAKFEMHDMNDGVQMHGGHLFFKCIGMESREQKRDISTILANGL